VQWFFQILTVALGVLGMGGFLSWYSIQENHGYGALTVGAWTAWPLAGDANADPYTKAKVAADGEVPLGAAEGLAFYARTDDAGRPLRAQCRYRLRGHTPPARYWTLTAHNSDGLPLRSPGEEIRRLTSETVTRDPDGEMKIEVSQKMAGGNWLETSETEAFYLVIRLYDTPVTGTRGIVDPRMPAIALIECPA